MLSGASSGDAGPLPGLGAPERTIIRVTRELISEPKVSAELFVEAQALFGNEGVMDLAGLVGLDRLEKEAIRQTLQLTAGNREKTAEMLGIGERTLYRKIKEFGIDV